jgi:hypothetical protein
MTASMERGVERAAKNELTFRRALSLGHESAADVMVVHGAGFIMIEKLGKEGNLVGRMEHADSL